MGQELLRRQHLMVQNEIGCQYQLMIKTVKMICLTLSGKVKQMIKEAEIPSDKIENAPVPQTILVIFIFPDHKRHNPFHKRHNPTHSFDPGLIRSLILKIIQTSMSFF